MIGGLAIGLPSASAASQFGNVCTAKGGAPPATWTQLSNESSGLPITAPINGVLTSWKVDSGLPASLQEQLKILRPSGKPNEFRVIGEQPAQSIPEGEDVFEARIPVQAGDRLALYSKEAVPLCTPAKTGDIAGFFPGDLLSTDAANPFGENAQLRVPVSAIVEPDVDGDGFGDETQDKCPQSAAFQTECPPIGLEDLAVPGKGSLTLLVIADHEAPVTVTAATVVGKRSKRRPLRGAALTLKGGTQTVKPNQFAKFKLKFPAALRAQLRGLPHGKSLKLTVTASATNLVGQVFKKTTTVSLKG